MRCGRVHMKVNTVELLVTIAASEWRLHRCRDSIIEWKACKQLLASGQLLRDHASGSDHGETAIVEFLVLHVQQFLRVLGLKAKWVKADITWLVVIFHFPVLSGKRILLSWIFKSEDREHLWDGNCCYNCWPEGLKRRLLESKIRWHVNVPTEEWVEIARPQRCPRMQASQLCHASTQLRGKREAYHQRCR